MPLTYSEAAPADGRFAADVLTARTPEDPRDPVLMADYWGQPDPGWTHRRELVLEGSERLGYLSVWWPEWRPDADRYAGCGVAVWPGREAALAEVVARAEEIARGAGAGWLTSDCPEGDAALIAAFEARGWERGRRAFRSEVDLRAGEARLRELWAATRQRLADQGIELTTLAGRDEAFLRRLLAAANSAWEDIPRSGPYTPLEFGGLQAWLGGLGSQPDTWWVAVADGQPVGLSVMGYPVERGFPHTDTTAVLREWRGKGVALGLKLATLVQAIERGYDRARTENDTENAPILHLNHEVLGYRVVPGEQEMRLRL